MKFPEWTDEKLAALPTNDLESLQQNATTKGFSDLASRCNTILSTRLPLRKSRKPRNTQIRNLEIEIAEDLGAFIVDLSKEFDLSAETAKRLSSNTKKFRAHNLTDPRGHAKTGGMHKTGQCELDRFVSYRVGDTVISLTAWLPKGRSTDEIEFHVYAPPQFLEHPQNWDELRPGTEKIAETSLYKYGQRYLDLDEAKAKMRHLIGKFAPKIA